MRKYPSQEILKETFKYHPNGYFIWKVTKSNSSVKGSVAGGAIDTRGYLSLGLFKKSWLLHRLIFIYHHGYDPENSIDHIDRDKLNNRISNLREVTAQCNQRNRKINKDNKSGITGVSFMPKVNKWRASIKLNNKKLFLGEFKCFDTAVEARHKKEVELNWNGCNSTSSAFLYLESNTRRKG